MDGDITIHAFDTGGCKRSKVADVVCFGLHGNHSLFLACQTQLSDTGTMRLDAKTVNGYFQEFLSDPVNPTLHWSMGHCHTHGHSPCTATAETAQDDQHRPHDQSH